MHKREFSFDTSYHSKDIEEKKEKPTMNRILAFLCLLLLEVHGFLPFHHQHGKAILLTHRAQDDNTASSKQQAASLEMDSNPCWEDLYDDDCVMTNAASARFVAADWIKSMPCGEGIQVSERTLECNDLATET